MLQKLISYFIPITRTVKSHYSGELELTLIDGRKVLDTANANYSYGSLQRVLTFSLRKVNLSEVKRVLILGLGGGSVIKTLREVFGYEGEIMAVDIDPVVIQIAKDEFGIIPDRRTRIECIDAGQYVKQTQEKFDLVIVDVFIDNRVPAKFLLVEFWHLLRKLVCDRGCVIFNSVSESSDTIELIKDELKKGGFETREYKNVERINTLLISIK
jgi:spermidine synthase